MLKTPQKMKSQWEGFHRSSNGMTDNDFRIQRSVESKKDAEEIIKIFIEVNRSRAEAIAYLHSLGIYLNRLRN